MLWTVEKKYTSMPNFCNFIYTEINCVQFVYACCRYLNICSLYMFYYEYILNVYLISNINLWYYHHS